MSENHKTVTEGNRAAWNAAADAHKAVRWEIILDQLAGKRDAPFNVPALDLFNEVEIDGKDIIQLACNNGRELLWLKGQGAGRAVGIDIADKFITQARELATLNNLEAEFHQANIVDVDASFDGQFDLALTTIGVFNWQPDLPAFMARVHRLLRPGGTYLIEEFHPILWMLEPDKGTELQYPYFDRQTYIEAAAISYYDGTDYEPVTRYEFQNTLSDVFTALITAGFRIASFTEFPIDNLGEFAHLENQPAQLPLSYNLIAEKIDDP